MRNSELGTKVDKEKAGWQDGQKSLYHTGKKLGSDSEPYRLLAHAEITQNWTLHQGLPCAPFCAGVLLLGRSRAGLRLPSAAHPG